MMDSTASGVTRRQLLVGSAALGGALAMSGAVSSTARASVPPPPPGLPLSQYFNLSAPSDDVFDSRNRPLTPGETTYPMQGMAFDNVNHRLFITQQSDSDASSLYVNHVDLEGNWISSMLVKKAGHGVSIGCDGVGSDSYIWIEAVAAGTGEDARGTALQRVKYVANTTIPAKTSSSAGLFLPGSTNITCSVDQINNRIMIRRDTGSGVQFTVYSLTEAKANNFSNALTAPLTKPSAIVNTFQGYTFFGSYLYILSGEHRPADDMTISRVSLVPGAGAVDDLNHGSGAGSTLLFREPEGMGVYRTVAGNLKLMFGIASQLSGSSTMYANLFDKGDVRGP